MAALLRRASDGDLIKPQCDLSRHHFFFVAVQLQSLQNGEPTVPVILVADSIVPLNATVKVVPLLPFISQPNTTLFTSTHPLTGHGGFAPTPKKVPLSISTSCLKTKVILIGPSVPIYCSPHVPVRLTAPASAPRSVRPKPGENTTNKSTISNWCLTNSSVQVRCHCRADNRAYCGRMAISGSTLVARLAGTKDASSATVSNKIGAATNVTGSVGVT